MTHLATFPIEDAAPLPAADGDVLLRWTSFYLRDCEKWLVRRHPLAPPADLLARARRRHAQPHDDTSLSGALASLTRRRARIRARGTGDGAHSALVDRLSHDLALYSASLSAGELHKVRVVPAGSAIVPLFLPGPDELFLPPYLMSDIPENLFPADSLFPEPPKATTSWLLFQSLVLVADRPRIPTLASFYDIRESD
ncbi:hypothetical protein [Streptomyces varsoviensis]|uniref:Uncharacterized protein n=1 Tax=Streptomyces varsoviensis TaxID=67373 RepID=A0ABR5ITS7_9ACTN|nr:hypothetical protein [Streptomyces varsoviensis]KOG58354.1 hypothetical protein ADK38_42860 [Streptomyces varsoviensis]